MTNPDNNNTPKPATTATGTSGGVSGQNVTGNKTTADAAGQKAKDLRDEVMDTARNVRDTAVEEGTARAEGAKKSLADEVSSVGKALRKASDELRDGSPQERAFSQVAETVAEFADSVRNKDLGEMFNDVNHFARRNPAVFLGGAALLGFAAARMAKATQRGGHDPYGGNSGYRATGAAGGTPYTGPAGTAGGAGAGTGTGATQPAAARTPSGLEK